MAVGDEEEKQEKKEVEKATETNVTPEEEVEKAPDANVTAEEEVEAVAEANNAEQEVSFCNFS